MLIDLIKSIKNFEEMDRLRFYQCLHLNLHRNKYSKAGLLIRYLLICFNVELDIFNRIKFAIACTNQWLLIPRLELQPHPKWTPQQKEEYLNGRLDFLQCLQGNIKPKVGSEHFLIGFNEEAFYMFGEPLEN